VRGDELAIEQREPARPEPRDEMGERHFRRIGRPAEHRFAEKGTAKLHAIKPADQLSIFPCLNAVRMPSGVEQRDRRLDLVVYPGRGPVRRLFGTHPHDIAECPVRRRLEPPGPERLGERAREPEAVQRQHTALSRLDPIDFGRVASVRHREYPGGIGLEEEHGIERFGHRVILVRLSPHSKPR
jgi:hypothetical protein